MGRNPSKMGRNLCGTKSVKNGTKSVKNGTKSVWDEICQNSTWDEICLGRNLPHSFHLVYISIFLNFLRQEKVTNSWFWAKLWLFAVFPILDCFIHSLFDKFYAQLTLTNLLNLWIYFDFKNYQPFSKYHARKVKFRRFTCIKIGN